MAVGGKKGGSISEINVTPMIDVLLVLLVIFMVAQPLLQRSIDVQVPKKEKTPAQAAPKIVLEIRADGMYYVNTRPVARKQLEQYLKEIYSARPDRLLFVKADSAVKFQTVIAAMDAARGAGVEVLGAVL